MDGVNCVHIALLAQGTGSRVQESSKSSPKIRHILVSGIRRVSENKTRLHWWDMPNHFGDLMAKSTFQCIEPIEMGDHHELVIGKLNAFMEGFHVYFVFNESRYTAECVSNERQISV